MARADQDTDTGNGPPGNGGGGGGGGGGVSYNLTGYLPDGTPIYLDNNGAPFTQNADGSYSAYSGSLAGMSSGQPSGTPPGTARNDPSGNSTNTTNPANQYTGNSNATSNTTNYPDAKSMMAALLSQGVDPQSAINQVNQQFNLQSGSSYAWRSIPGAPGGGVVEVPGGSYFAPGPDGVWGWNAGDSGGGGGANPAANPNNVPAVAPWQIPGGGPSQYQVPGGAPGQFQAMAPFTPQVWNQTFAAPTEQDLLNSPGYLASQEAAALGLQRQAAANGSILSGGFAGIALPRALGQLASNQYQQLYNNAFTNYQQTYNQFQQANTNAMNAYGVNAAEQLNAYNTNQTAYQNSVNNALAAFNANENAYQNNVQNSLNQYNTRYQAYQDLIRNNLSYAGLGLNATTAGSPGAPQ